MVKIVKKRVRRSGGGVNLVADVNAVIASSRGSTGHVRASSRRSVRIVQKDGRTEVTETREGGSEA